MCFEVIDSTRFEPFNLTLNFRNHGYTPGVTFECIKFLEESLARDKMVVLVRF